MFLVRATEASKTKAVQVLTRIEETALLTHQLKLAYFVHIAETEANLAEFEVFWGKLYERTVLYTTSLAMLDPYLPLKYSFFLKYPPILKLYKNWQQKFGTQHPRTCRPDLDLISSRI